MTFVPKYDAVSEEALIDNIAIWLAANFKQGLDAFYPTDDLADFAETALGMVMGLQFPALGLGPSRNASTEAEDSSHLREALQVDLDVVVVDDSPATSTRRIMRYMRTLEAVLRRARIDDLFGAENANNTFGFVLDCEHVYDQDIRVQGSTYLREARLELTVQINEVRINR